MTSSTRADWLVPTLLIMLSAVPVAAGTVRLVQLAGGAEITPDNSRFFAAPLPVVLHIISVTLYCVLGAFQFAPGFRRRRPNWHRAAGRILVPCGLIAALSGLWMTQFYAPVDGDGPILYGIRLLVGSAMVLFICLGFAAIRRRGIPRHRAWMMRGYAIGLGAGTQAFTGLSSVLILGTPGELGRALYMGAGWAINIVVAEWIIRRQPKVKSAHQQPLSRAWPRRKVSAGGGTMQAIVQEGYGAPQRVLKLEEVGRPPVGDDDGLIRVRATSVNTPDWITVTGAPHIIRLGFGLRQPPTPVRGTDIAGVVEAVGKNVTDLQPGDEVFGSSWADTLATRAGTLAEFTVAPASKLIKKPGTLTFEEAGASPLSGLTALIAMREVGKVGPETRVLISGASGGVGTFAVQIAKVLGGDVTGVCSTKNLELIQSLGADHVIDYTEEDFNRSERRHDVILDNVMNRWPSATARVLSPTGTPIPNSIGNTGGFFAGLPRMARAGLMGRDYTDVQFVTCVVNREHLGVLAALLESGDVRAVIYKVYPLSEAANAVAHMFGHRARGNVVIAV